jgi:peptidoglycan/xylan/chitin deacetylase (PgdA/CDA1 family)
MKIPAGVPIGLLVSLSFWQGVWISTPADIREVARGPVGHRQIALTFDAGGDASCFSDLTRALASARVQSTFFVTGRWAAENPECAHEITQLGHEVGNHTWHHFDLTRLPDAKVREELSQAESLIIQFTGQNPRPFFRAPFGARDARILRLARQLEYRSIYWTIDSLDSVAPPKTAAFLIHRITARRDEELDGAIILMHVGESSTAEALPAVIANLQGRGFHFVTLSTLLAQP